MYFSFFPSFFSLPFYCSQSPNGNPNVMIVWCSRVVRIHPCIIFLQIKLYIIVMYLWVLFYVINFFFLYWKMCSCQRERARVGACRFSVVCSQVQCFRGPLFSQFCIPEVLWFWGRCIIPISNIYQFGLVVVKPVIAAGNIGPGEHRFCGT